MCSRSIYTRPGDQDVDLDSETDLIGLIASVPWSLAYASLISTFTATLEVGPVPSTPQVECRASTMTCRLQDPQNASHTHDNSVANLNLTIRPPYDVRFHQVLIRSARTYENWFTNLQNLGVAGFMSRFLSVRF